MILVFGGAYQGKRDFARQLLESRRSAAGGTARAPEQIRIRDWVELQERAGIREGGELRDCTWTRNGSELQERAGIRGRDEAALPDFSADIICGLEALARACIEAATAAAFTTGAAAEADTAEAAITGAAAETASEGAAPAEAADWMRARRDLWQDKILVITDVSQGIVPMEAETRAFREMNGRLMLYLAREAEEVYRVFCGIGKRIK